MGCDYTLYQNLQTYCMGDLVSKATVTGHSARSKPISTCNRLNHDGGAPMCLHSRGGGGGAHAPTLPMNGRKKYPLQRAILHMNTGEN